MARIESMVIFILLLIAVPVAAEIRVTDDLGNEIVLDQPAQRIVSLAPNITELLFFVGAGKQIIGADEYSNYPEAAKKIPRVNNYAAANYELILSLKPDVVIAWQTGNGDKIVDRIRQLGLPIFVIEPRRLKDIPDIFMRLGNLTGHALQAKQQGMAFTRQLNALAVQYERKKPVSVFYQIWNEPLITLNGEHLVSDVIALCGGENVFAEAAPLVPYVSIEAVVRANPEVIIASGSTEESPGWLGMWDKWPMIDAVKNNRVHFIPPDLMQRHSVRIIQGATQVCEFLDGARSQRPGQAAFR